MISVAVLISLGLPLVNPADWSAGPSMVGLWLAVFVYSLCHGVEDRLDAIVALLDDAQGSPSGLSGE